MKNYIFVVLLSSFISLTLLGTDANHLDLHRIASVEYTDERALLALAEVEVTQEMLLQNDLEGRTPFHVAIIAGKLQVARKLVDSNKMVLELCDKYFYSPFHSAVQNMSEDTVAFLIEMGANPANSCNETLPMRLLLEGIPNFRFGSRYSGTNFWPIGQNIVKMIGAKMSVDHLRADLKFVCGLKGSNRERNESILNYFESPLQSALKANEQRSMKRQDSDVRAPVQKKSNKRKADGEMESKASKKKTRLVAKSPASNKKMRLAAESPAKEAMLRFPCMACNERNHKKKPPA